MVFLSTSENYYVTFTGFTAVVFETAFLEIIVALVEFDSNLGEVTIVFYIFLSAVNGSCSAILAAIIDFYSFLILVFLV